MHNQWQSPPPKNQQPPLQPLPQQQPPPQTTSTITGSSNKFQIQKPQKKKKTQNLQQNSNPTDQSMKKLNQPSAVRSAKAKATKYQIPIELRFRSRRTYPFSWFSPSNKTQIR